MSRPTLLALALALATAALSASCKPKHVDYTSTALIGRVTVIRTDDKGAPLTGDVEVDWDDCPGDQKEVIRGDAAFVACVSKLPINSKQSVKVRWSAGEQAHDWEILALGPCPRTPDPDDETSFDMVQECEPVVEHGANVGFHCNRVPKKALVAKCPWFKRD